MKKRIEYLDHAKAILIILVVLGHLLEKIPFQNNKALYLCIYAFHMPAFIFISGLCYHKGAKIIKLINYYFIFQTFYMICDYLEKGDKFQFSYTTPVWIMWYLLSLIFWYIIGNYLPSDKKRGLLVFILSIALALIAGYDKTIGRYLSLSRTIVFFPFFWGGYYIKCNFLDKFDELVTGKESKILFFRAVVFINVALSMIFIIKDQSAIKKYWFYGTNAYNEKGYTLIVRIVFLIAAMLFTLAFLMLVPKKENKVLAFIGKNTLPVYLYHGIIIKLAAVSGFFVKVKHPLIEVLSLTILLTAFFCMDPVGKIVRLCKNKYERAIL